MNLSELLRCLETETGCSVSLEYIHSLFLESERLHLQPDQYLHHAPFCRNKKLTSSFEQCARWKAQTMRHAASGKAEFFICPFRITEYVIPFFHQEKCAAVLYFSSNQQELSAGQQKAVQEKAAFAIEFLRREFDILALTPPEKKHNENYYAENARRFIDNHFSENIGIAELAETLHVHKGHLGEQLKKACGKSFRTMLAERRVDEAKVYLKRQQHLSIAHIATLCGFPDSNYFSTVFHRCTGMTPTDYRLQADNA